MLLSQLADVTARKSSLKSLSLENVFRFLRYATLAREFIQHMQKDISLPPKHLPPSSLRLFASLLQVTPATISSLWSLLRFEVWSSPNATTVATEAEVKAYNKVALDLGTCECSLHSFHSLSDILHLSIQTSLSANSRMHVKGLFST